MPFGSVVSELLWSVVIFLPPGSAPLCFTASEFYTSWQCLEESSHGPIHYLTAVHNGNGGPFELWVRSGLILVCTSLLSELTQALCAPRVGSENWRITSIGP